MDIDTFTHMVRHSCPERGQSHRPLHLPTSRRHFSSKHITRNSPGNLIRHLCRRSNRKLQPLKMKRKLRQMSI